MPTLRFTCDDTLADGLEFTQEYELGSCISVMMEEYDPETDSMRGCVYMFSYGETIALRDFLTACIRDTIPF